jgi:hypothetical protein
MGFPPGPLVASAALPTSARLVSTRSRCAASAALFQATTSTFQSGEYAAAVGPAGNVARILRAEPKRDMFPAVAGRLRLPCKATKLKP